MDLEDKNSSCAEGQELQDPKIEANQTTPLTEEKIPDEIKPSEELPQGADKKELYEEILDKLDIQKKNGIQPSQESSMQDKSKQEAILKGLQNLERLQVKKQIEQGISQDFAKIQGLLKAGLINSEQGQNLKKQVLKKAFDKLVQSEKIKRNLLPASQNKMPQNTLQQRNTLDEFSQNNPEFFTPQGRKEVLDYLKSGNINLGKDELNKISEIIKIVEKSAIDRYLQKANHEKTLTEANESAKQKLTANAQKSGCNTNLTKSFTREQIGKMSSAEFTKNEPYIMEQLKKGLIK